MQSTACGRIHSTHTRTLTRKRFNLKLNKQLFFCLCTSGRERERESEDVSLRSEPGCGLNAASWHHQKLYQLNLAIFYASPRSPQDVLTMPAIWWHPATGQVQGPEVALLCSRVVLRVTRGHSKNNHEALIQWPATGPVEMESADVLTATEPPSLWVPSPCTTLMIFSEFTLSYYKKKGQQKCDNKIKKH